MVQSNHSIVCHKKKKEKEQWQQQQRVSCPNVKQMFLINFLNNISDMSDMTFWVNITLK